MSVLTHTYPGTGPATVPTANSAPRRKSLWRSFVDTMIAARMRRAELEIARRGYLFPRDLERADWKATARSEDSLPFVR